LINHWHGLSDNDKTQNSSSKMSSLLQVLPQNQAHYHTLPGMGNEYKMDDVCPTVLGAQLAEHQMDGRSAECRICHFTYQICGTSSSSSSTAPTGQKVGSPQ